MIPMPNQPKIVILIKDNRAVCASNNLSFSTETLCVYTNEDYERYKQCYETGEQDKFELPDGKIIKTK